MSFTKWIGSRRQAATAWVRTRGNFWPYNFFRLRMISSEESSQQPSHLFMSP